MTLNNNLNILIAIILIILNVIPIYIYGYRKKKFGIYALTIFIIVFCSYLVYYTFPFKNAIDEKQHLYEMERSTDETNLDKKNYSGDIDKEEKNITAHLKNMDILLRTSTMQSFLCISLCIIGLSVVSGRNRYYITLLFIHLIFFCFCCILEGSEHFTN